MPKLTHRVITKFFITEISFDDMYQTCQRAHNWQPQDATRRNIGCQIVFFD